MLGKGKGGMLGILKRWRERERTSLGPFLSGMEILDMDLRIPTTYSILLVFRFGNFRRTQVVSRDISCRNQIRWNLDRKDARFSRFCHHLLPSAQCSTNWSSRSAQIPTGLLGSKTKDEGLAKPIKIKPVFPF